MTTRSAVIDLIVKLKGGQQVSQDIKGVQNSFGDLHESVFSLKGLLAGITVGAVFAVIADQMDAAVKSASDLQEATSKFDTVFAGQRGQAREWADELVDSYAMSTRESKQYLASLQDLLVPMGMTNEAAGKMSYEITKLSADLGSFNNQLTADVIDDYQSALVGNYETMKKYGVVLSAATVEQEALAMGLAKTKDELTAAQKAQAAHAIILRSSSAAIGDMQRTGEEHANTVKKLDARWEDFSATLGQKFLGSATSAKAALAGLLEAATDLMKGPGFDQQIAEAQAKYDRLVAENEAKKAAQEQTANEKALKRKEWLIARLKQQEDEYQQRLTAQRKKEAETAPQGTTKTKLEWEIDQQRVLLAELRKIQAERQKIDEQPPPAAEPPPAPGKAYDPVTPTDLGKSDIARLQALAEVSMAQLDQLYAEGTVSLNEYFSQRRAMIDEQAAKELDALHKLAAAEPDPTKKLALEDQLFEREERHKLDLIDLANEQTDAEAKLAEAKRQINEILAESEERAEEKKDGLQQQFDDELYALEKRQEAEIEAIEELYAAREELDEEYLNKREALEEAARNHALEQEQLSLDQERRMQLSRVKLAASVASAISGTFQELYEAFGKGNKKLFLLMKAAKIAETVINTAAAVMTIWATAGMHPYEKVAWSIYAVAQGAAQIATISAQQLARGGRVGGSSSNDRQDNVPIWATADEWVIQRPTTRHYGARIMDAINRAAIPKEVLEGWLSGISLPASTRSASYALAAGGAVPAAPDMAGGYTIGELNLAVAANDARSFAENPELVADALNQALRLSPARRRKVRRRL